MSPNITTLIKCSALAAILSLSFTFCKKPEAIVEEEPVAETPTLLPPQPITALKIDSTNTTVQIVQTGSTGILNNSPWNSNSYPFDLDNDGINDVSVEMESSKGASGFFECTQNLKTLRSDVFLLCDSVYSLTPYAGYNFGPSFTNEPSLIVKDLNYGDTIKKAGKWRSGSILVYRDYSVWDTINKPPHQAGANYAPLLSWKYISVKCGNRLAWLKVYSVSGTWYSRLTIKERAISN
jgi:hypothetical protein